MERVLGDPGLAPIVIRKATLFNRTVNQRVVGSSPTGESGSQSIQKAATAAFCFLPTICQQEFWHEAKS